MQPSKWEVWPWNWRKVRKAKISKQDRDLFERYGEAVIGSILAGETPIVKELQAILPHYDPPDGPLEDKFAEARNWLTECRDSQHRREQRLETVEIGVVALITVEILLSVIFGAIGIYEAWKQGKVLDHMDASTAASVETMQTVRDEIKSFAADQAKMREILQRQEDARLAQLAKKPEFALDVGHIPLLKRHATFTPAQETDSSVTYHLDLWNRGDITANRLYLRALVSSKDVTAVSSPSGLAPEPDAIQSFILAQDFLPPDSYFPVDITFAYQKGHAPFQVTFKTGSEESRTPTLLGVLPVNPRTPSK